MRVNRSVIRVCSVWQKQGLLTTSKDGFVLRSLDELRTHTGPGAMARAALAEASGT